MNFKNVIKSAITRSGGSLDKISMEEFIDSIDYSLTLDPGNYWLGIKIFKNPLDLIILQEIIFEKRPDTIIETGTLYGGSAYYMASLMDLMKIDGKIISIDHDEPQVSVFPKMDSIKIDGKTVNFNYDDSRVPIHPKIEFIRSNCLTSKIPKLGSKTMVILDCDHSASHVYKELNKFSNLVTLGQYLIVEDTDANKEEGGGPAAAKKRFLSENKKFKVDKGREKYGISTSLGGYLLRIS